MSFKNLLQFFDAPLAIVVGGVATALIVGQLVAASMAAYSQGIRVDEQQSVRSQRSALSACTEMQSRSASNPCMQVVGVSGMPPASLHAIEDNAVAFR